MANQFIRRLAAGTTALIAFSLTILTGCLPGGDAGPQIVFSPPPGLYSSAPDVSMRVINLNPIGTSGLTARVIFTTDGSTPDLDNCEDPYDSPVHIPASVLIKAAYTTDGYVLKGHTEAQYVISGGGGGTSGDDPTRDALIDWQDYESTVTNWFFCEFNGCQTPAEANVILCDSSASDGEKCLPWTIRQYDAAGNVTGTAYFDAREFNAATLEAKTLIRFDNFKINYDGDDMVTMGIDPLYNSGAGRQTLHQPQYAPGGTAAYGFLNAPTDKADFELSVTGELVGKFNLSQEGYNRTPTPLTTVTGDSYGTYETGTIDDYTNISSAGIKESGKYIAGCTGNADCGTGLTYLAPIWELFVRSDIPDSCASTYLMISSLQKPDYCLKNNTRVSAAKCDPNDEAQKWSMVSGGPTVTMSDTDGDGTPDTQVTTPTYSIRNLGSDQCLTYVELLGDDHYEMQDCSIGDDDQRYYSSGSAHNNSLRPASASKCLEQSSNAYTPYTVYAAFSCNSNVVGQKWGFLNKGVVPAQAPRDYVDGTEAAQP